MRETDRLLRGRDESTIVVDYSEFNAPNKNNIQPVFLTSKSESRNSVKATVRLFATVLVVLLLWGLAFFVSSVSIQRRGVAKLPQLNTAAAQALFDEGDRIYIRLSKISSYLRIDTRSNQVVATEPFPRINSGTFVLSLTENGKDWNMKTLRGEIVGYNEATKTLGIVVSSELRKEGVDDGTIHTAFSFSPVVETDFSKKSVSQGRSCLPPETFVALRFFFFSDDLVCHFNE